MKLEQYLEETGIKKKVFAKKAGISEGCLYDILREKQDLSLSTAIRIHEQTGGKVTYNDLNFRPKYLMHKRKTTNKKDETSQTAAEESEIYRRSS